MPGLVTDGGLYCAYYDEATAWDATTGALRWKWTERPDSVPAEPYAQQLSVGARAGDTVALLGTVFPALGQTGQRRFVVVALDLRDGTMALRTPAQPVDRDDGPGGAGRRLGRRRHRPRRPPDQPVTAVFPDGAAVSDAVPGRRPKYSAAHVGKRWAGPAQPT